MNSQHQMGMEIFAHHTSVMIILFVSILVNLTLIYYFFRHRKNIRCLRYCYIDLSDWVIRKMEELEKVSHEMEIPEISDEWWGMNEQNLSGCRGKSNYHKGLLERRNVQWFDESDLSYPLEDEREELIGKIRGASNRESVKDKMEYRREKIDREKE